MTDEYYFKYGYSLFCLEKYDDHMYIKSTRRKIQGFFHNILYISYVQKLYHKSLSGFQSLSQDKMFSRIVPYYITQIYFYLEEYSEVVNITVPLLENVLSSRESEINRIVSDSYYHISDYESTIIYFNRYLEITEEIK